MTMKTKRFTIDRTEFNKQDYDNLTVQMIEKEQVIPINSVMLMLHRVLAESNTEV